ncbi:MAG: ABC-F family ATP-binding cassette domain-containing protein [Bacteroidales bacterium]|nr:ABC-F family ATP-binding cassette domain-containing protein [Bacteroidales bacterium]
MIAVRDIEVTFGSFTLMKNVSFLVNRQERIGLAGRNGAGKTTLLKIMAGQQQPTSGFVELPGEVRVGYLPQQMKVSDTTSVLDETLTAFSALAKMESEIEDCRTEIAFRTDYHSSEYLDVCDRLNVLEERFAILGGTGYVAESEQTLLGLGFERERFSQPTAELSGGWRMRIELAKVLLSHPDVLLLDEPTNHLDIESIRWLEQHLREFKGAVVLVSHDRAFLDNITSRTLEISAGKLHDYRVPYSRYEVLRKERREQLEASYRNQQKLIDDTEKFIERFRYKATKAVQVQSRIKQLDKIERIEIDEQEMPAMDIRFAPAPRSGTVVVEAEKLTKRYDEKTVLHECGIIIERGEKIAFVGRNGEGKTTFARIIMGETDYSGLFKKGHNVRTGYFAQNQDELLNEEKTVFGTIDEVAVGDIRTKIRDLLGAFLFSGDDVEKKVKVLSGGERSRLALVKLLLEPYNLLLLDEPTNHLDMRSKEILKQSLLKYDGTLLVVSHDRDFLDGLVTKVYEFRNHKIRQHIGGIYDYLRRKDQENRTLAQQSAVTAASVRDKRDSEASHGRLKHSERKEYARSLRRLEKRVMEIEERITTIESEIKEMDKLLENPTPPPGKDFFDRYSILKEQLTIEMKAWEEAHGDLEEYISENGN